MIFLSEENFSFETMQALCNLATINGAPLLKSSFCRKVDRGFCNTFAGSSAFTGLFCKGFLGKNGTVERGDFFIRATWRFGGGGGKSTSASIEHSEAAVDDILLFYYKLDLETRVQVRAICSSSFLFLHFFVLNRISLYHLSFVSMP
jgi:hypothetical protein